ncbi:uncharacterized protein [Ptychodera flava]|uniref:uncharacterized protein n=1 Tax=Ptychodera flava TaxID=63121 RepID=UPI00396A74F2
MSLDLRGSILIFFAGAIFLVLFIGVTLATLRHCIRSCREWLEERRKSLQTNEAADAEDETAPPQRQESEFSDLSLSNNNDSGHSTSVQDLMTMLSKVETSSVTMNPALGRRQKHFVEAPYENPQEEPRKIRVGVKRKRVELHCRPLKWQARIS